MVAWATSRRSKGSRVQERGIASGIRRHRRDGGPFRPAARETGHGMTFDLDGAKPSVQAKGESEAVPTSTRPP